MLDTHIIRRDQIVQSTEVLIQTFSFLFWVQDFTHFCINSCFIVFWQYFAERETRKSFIIQGREWCPSDSPARSWANRVSPSLSVLLGRDCQGGEFVVVHFQCRNGFQILIIHRALQEFHSVSFSLRHCSTAQVISQECRKTVGLGLQSCSSNACDGHFIKEQS